MPERLLRESALPALGAEIVRELLPGLHRSHAPGRQTKALQTKPLARGSVAVCRASGSGCWLSRLGPAADYIGRRGAARVSGEGIFLLRGEDELVELRPRPYASEEMLQALIARFPNLLAGDQAASETQRR
jgi:hypothetical protein